MLLSLGGLGALAFLPLPTFSAPCVAVNCAWAWPVVVVMSMPRTKPQAPHPVLTLCFAICLSLSCFCGDHDRQSFKFRKPCAAGVLAEVTMKA